MEPIQLQKPTQPYLAMGAGFGNYRVVKFLAEGGMGQIYLAEHPELGRLVAVKILRPEISGYPDAVRRFFQEARLVNAIRNDHIVDISDIGKDGEGRLYYVMEFLEGGTLADVRDRQGPFRVARALTIAEQVAGALKATHDKGVIHRDVKPANVFLCERGEDRDFVKLLDFGIAKLLEGSSASRTREGIVVGSPEYMSPEQAGGSKVDGRTDVYQLGLLLYWMLADRLPFANKDPAEMMRERRARPPEPLPKRSISGEDIPPWLDALVTACLALDPGARPSMADALHRLHEPAARPSLPRDAAVVAPVQPEAIAVRPDRRLWLGSLLGAGLAALAVAALWLGMRRPSLPQPDAPTRAAAPPPSSAPTPPGLPTPAPEPIPTRVGEDVGKQPRPARVRGKSPAAPGPGRAGEGDAPELAIPANLGH